MAKFLDYEGLQELLKYLALEAGNNVTIERDSDTHANIISAHLTAEEIGSLTSVTASGTSPLTLEATTVGTDVTITGSVDLSDYYTKEDADSAIQSAVEAAIEAVEGEESDTLKDYIKASNVTAGDGISVTTGTDRNGDATVTITNSLDLSSYATKDDLDGATATLESEISTKQDILTAGTGIDITDNVISCTLDTTVFKIVESLPTSDIDENVIYVVPADNTGENNTYVEYIYVNGAWEKLGEFQAETDLSDYYTKSEVDALIAAAQLAIDNEEAEIQEIFSTMLTKSEAASTYQEILTAGDGISLNDNTVSLNLSASATGDSLLTLDASISGGDLTITGSVDLEAIEIEEIDGLFD